MATHIEMPRYRLRSRTPPQDRIQGHGVSGDCCICLEPLDGEESWRCLVCQVIIHWRCIPKSVEGRATLENGCPQCRFRMQDALDACTRSAPAPYGAVCAVCNFDISRGDLMMACAAPRYHCVAVWHAQCYPRRCPGCRLSTYRALQLRLL